MASRTPKMYHITPVLASLHWLPVKERADFKVLLLKQYMDLLLLISPIWTCRTYLHAGLLIVPRISKQTAGGRAFSYRAPFLWNGLPIHVRDADSVSTFQSLLKTHLFSASYDECSLAQWCEGERKGSGATNRPCCLCLAGSPLSTGILCL